MEANNIKYAFCVSDTLEATLTRAHTAETLLLLHIHTHEHDTRRNTKKDPKKKNLSIILPNNELNKRMIIRFVINYIYIFQYFNYLLNVNYIHI